MHAQNMQRLLTTRQVAERLSVHPSTVRKLVADGDLVAVRIGRMLRFEPRLVDAMVDGWRSAQPPVEELASGRQLRGLFARCRDLRLLTGKPDSMWKRDAFDVVQLQFGVTIGSATELTSRQATYAIEWLEQQRTAVHSAKVAELQASGP